MKRTIQTMQILYPQKSFFVNENLKELNFGNFELKSYEELKENTEYIKWINDVENFKIPNGESNIEFKSRVIIGFSEIFEYALKNKINDVIIICHSGVISTFMQNIFKNAKNFYEWLPECGRGYSIIFEKSNNINYNKI